MNQYAALLYIVWANEPCTRFYIEHLQHGKFKDQIDACIHLGYIYSPKTNEAGDNLYYISDLGRKIVDNPKEELL